MMPLLYRHLYTRYGGTIPKDVLAALRHHYSRNAAANLVLTRDLLKISALFAGNDIPALPFKGPTLAGGVYGDLSLREAGDLDILIRETDVRQATDLLLANGYRRLAEHDDLGEPAHLGAHWEAQFARDDGTVGVELQWRIEPHWEVGRKSRKTAIASPLRPERLWERRQALPLPGAAVATPHLSPEDLLLILCVHGTKHLWTRLAWICDVAETVRAYPDLNWERVFRMARETDSERMLHLGLHLANDLLASALPDPIASRLSADPTTSALARQVQVWLFRDTAPTLREEFRFHRQIRKQLRSRLSYYRHYFRVGARTVLTPNEKDRAGLSLPPFLSFMYYLLRPIRLVRGGVSAGLARRRER
jgi:hypothetical protein